VSAGKNSIPVLLSFLIIMFITVIGCGKMEATSVISGEVDGDIAANVTINMTGGATVSLTTDANGEYNFNNVENGYYTITPYLDGYSFSPANTEVEINGMSAADIDFTSSWVGYSISGKVTGDVVANVTLTAYSSGTTTSVTTATTDSDGKYALTSTSIGENVDYYDVKPSLTGYKFTPSIRENISAGGASVTIDDFVSEATHAKGSAKGTYTWNSSSGDLIITWTSVTAPCNWPKAGSETESLVTISKTIMTWPDEVQWPGLMIWTRTSSTKNNPAGEWTLTDQSGNTYTATFTVTSSTTDPDTDLITAASGSISLAETIVNCAYAWSTSDFKEVSLSYQDPEKEATTVSVSGSGISTQSLDYNSATGAWSTGVLDISSLPTAPFTYTFTITDSGTTWEETSCFVDWPTDLAPTGTITTKLPTFEWTEIADSGSSYMVQLRDSNYNLIWESDTDTGSSFVYTGATAFKSGSTYYYYVIVMGTDACGNGRSFATGSFTYSP